MIECAEDCGAVHPGPVGSAIADGWAETEDERLLCGTCSRGESGPPPAMPSTLSAEIAADLDVISVEFSDDLPEELKSILPGARYKALSDRDYLILRLLAEKGRLKIDALMIGIYRGSGKLVKPGAMHQAMCALKKRELVERCGWGEYGLSAAGLDKHDAKISGLDGTS